MVPLCCASPLVSSYADVYDKSFGLYSPQLLLFTTRHDSYLEWQSTTKTLSIKQNKTHKIEATITERLLLLLSSSGAYSDELDEVLKAGQISVCTHTHVCLADVQWTLQWQQEYMISHIKDIGSRIARVFSLFPWAQSAPSLATEQSRR